MDSIKVNTSIKHDIIYKLIQINVLNQSIIDEILEIKNKIEIIEYDDNVIDNYNYLATLTSLSNIKHIIKLNKDKEYNINILKLLFIQNPKIKIKCNNDLINIDDYIEGKIIND